MISEEYTVVLLLENSDAYANLITQSFSTTGEPHILRRVTDIGSMKDYLVQSLDSHSTENYIKPRLIVISVDAVDDDLRDLIRFIRSDGSLKLIPVVLFCSASCDDSIGHNHSISVNSFINRTLNVDKDKEVVANLASYWLKWSHLPP
jgi:hypothetical protein